jgi:hypothetical protein
VFSPFGRNPNMLLINFLTSSVSELSRGGDCGGRGGGVTGCFGVINSAMEGGGVMERTGVPDGVKEGVLDGVNEGVPDGVKEGVSRVMPGEYSGGGDFGSLSSTLATRTAGTREEAFCWRSVKFDGLGVVMPLLLFCCIKSRMSKRVQIAKFRFA